MRLSPSLVGPLGPVAVAQQVVDLAVGAHPVHDRAVLGDRLERLVGSSVGHVCGFSLRIAIAQPVGEHDVVLRVTAERARRPERLVNASTSPAELREQLHAGLLDVADLRYRPAASRHRLLDQRIEIERRHVDLPGHQLRQQQVAQRLRALALCCSEQRARPCGVDDRLEASLTASRRRTTNGTAVSAFALDA